MCIRDRVKRGNWTEEEHKLFLEAIEKYGNNWKRIQAHLKTRTCIQIRSHCQRYFSKLEKKAIRKAKKNKEDKLFVVYRTYRNMTFCSNTVNKIELDTEGLKNQPKEYEEIDSGGSEEENEVLDFIDPVEIQEPSFFQDLSPGLYDKYPDLQQIREDSYVQPDLEDMRVQNSLGSNSPPQGDKYENSIFANYEDDVLNSGIKQSMGWQEECFESTQKRKIKFLYDICYFIVYPRQLSYHSAS
eukprot:TRINITY_DN3627_c0_g1_i3.p1 TRINITY_DN3627_c0_g1~~TRINITY_DN3627_c0_g1_i3.p1  ORF type:complete len:242 (+),score=24.28 TRINITY_DN3627_c0_g1_i3:71-796(+)